MKSQNQYTIYSVNDVVTQSTAPTNPYKGQLWVDTSKTPPITKIWDGTAWKEQNGTDEIKTSISTITTKQATFETNLSGLTSTVSATTEKVETIESDLGDVEKKVLDTETTVSTLSQTVGSFETRISTTEGSVSSLSQTVGGFQARISSAEGSITTINTAIGNIRTKIVSMDGDISTLTQTTSSISAEVTGKLDAEGYGVSFSWALMPTGFEIKSGSSTVFSVNADGLNVTGTITANSGSLKDMTITGKLYFGGDTSYYISANYNDSNYYISLPGLKIDKASTAVFSGKLSAPSGTIGGFTISTSSIYKTKTSYSSTTSGVYLGTDGIGLGAGTFYVTSAGKLHATDAEITGSVTATSGSFTGSLTCSDGTIGGFTIGASSLTNAGGASYIELTKNNYTTRIGWSNIYSRTEIDGAYCGFALSNTQMSVSDYQSSQHCGVVISTTFQRRTNRTAFSNATVAEGCITSAWSNYYDADSRTTYWTGTPFIIGMSRTYADSPYQPVKEWGSYLRFVDWNSCEMVFDSYHSGKWKLRNANDDATYDLTTLIPWLNTHKYYVWVNTSSITTDDTTKQCLASTHGFSTVVAAIVTTRYTGSLSGTSHNARWAVYINGTTVTVGNDDGDSSTGFYCVIFGY